MSLKQVFCRHNSKLQNEPNQTKHILIFSAKIKRKDWKAYLNCYLGCVGDKVFRSWVVFKIPFHLVQIVSGRHFEWYSFPASRMICWERFGIVGKGNLESEIGLCICFLYFHFCNIHTSRLLRLNSFILFYPLFFANVKSPSRHEGCAIRFQRPTPMPVFENLHFPIFYDSCILLLHNDMQLRESFCFRTLPFSPLFPFFSRNYDESQAWHDSCDFVHFYITTRLWALWTIVGQLYYPLEWTTAKFSALKTKWSLKVLSGIYSLLVIALIQLFHLRQKEQ